ncbi:RNA-directed DNA polymerase [Leptospira sp. 201903070]|uniref:RNA-directed DNA polymerase n=1 Tax=Leptospira ainlahdjerensis TaxID=2810033 RepID=A0ABS2U784_9LEPT|nr:antiviral reverse transcriptase Drt3b [Leptospira ainlahdjerensis]MBM9576224.1 RNA-directed DNA polymerase [Leptospira ainlahdjerensis]
MLKNKINRSIYERCLLTEVVPFETPMLFSNWGAFNFVRNLKNKSPHDFINKLFCDKGYSVPYRFRIKKDNSEFRSLHLIHPKMSERIITLYQDFQLQIIKECSKSLYSLRAPSRIAKYFTISKSNNGESVGRYVEELDADSPYISSYFVYKYFSHLHKYFESEFFTSLEKRFKNLMYQDVSKCFPSLYTHSISWALRGKVESKSIAFKGKSLPSLGVLFDEIMQDCNFKETNGIVIGPEISRLFAEIVMQSIDEKIDLSMRESGFKYGTDYVCVRYIDDYYLFYNNNAVAEKFSLYISEELEVFKLYLNTAKTKVTSRPFITQISRVKIKLSYFMDDLEKRISTAKSNISSERELNKIRDITFDLGDESHTISNFLLSSIKKKMIRMSKMKISEEIRMSALLVFIEMAFHRVRFDTRVSSVYRIAEIILESISLIDSMSSSYQRQVKDKISSEIKECLFFAIENDSIQEALNLLIAYSKLSFEYSFSEKDLLKIANGIKRSHPEDIKYRKRLSYYEIVTILYYIKDNQLYNKIRKLLLATAFFIIRSNSILIYAESAYIFFDLLSCPYLTANEKNKLFKMALDGSEQKVVKNRRKSIIDFVSKDTWFFNWNKDKDLHSILKKKEYNEPY